MTRRTTNEYTAVDVRRWHREGLLSPGREFQWEWLRNQRTVASIQVCVEPDRLVLMYEHKDGTGRWVSHSEPVLLSWTRCNYGGRRPWLLCPACGRRVATLYGGAVFTCRRCRKLAYPSQRETAGDRASRRANKLRKRLGWRAGFLNGSGGRPKGMHSNTFERLSAEHDRLLRRCQAEAFGWLMKTHKALTRLSDQSRNAHSSGAKRSPSGRAAPRISAAPTCD